MKLIGFNNYYIEKMDFSFISSEEMNSLMQYDEEEGNVQIKEDVNVGLAEGFQQAKITAEIQVLDIENLRKLEITIVGFFELDNENIEDGKEVSDFMYSEGWPLLNKYVKPAISTILNISNTGQLEV